MTATRHGKDLYDKALSELSYEPETGIIRWAVHKRKAKPGTVAGSVDCSTGYIDIGFYGKHLLGHRFAWYYTYGEIPEFQIDHVDGNRSNNAIHNLRKATCSQNNHNSKSRKNNTSGIKGVSWYSRISKWDVRIMVNKKQHHLGYFENLNDAKRVIENFREKLHGEYANHG